ncbi:hypothetical protein OF83DRAFT_573963 [Amylostereum chailletii]|nr:hypothetical protein OF83DRAFT_573963 [Amylostereum chailletii]
MLMKRHLLRVSWADTETSSCKSPVLSSHPSSIVKPSSSHHPSHLHAMESAPSKDQWSLLDKHEFAQYVLEETGEYFPSLAEIQATTELPNTLSSLKQRVNELETRHTEDLERLYDHQAQRYLDDAHDRYLQFDDTQVGPESKPEFIAQMDRMTRGAHASTSLLSLQFDNEVDQIRIAHLKHINPLRKRRDELMGKDELDRRRREASFPKSLEEYNAIGNKDKRLRIALFLSADKTGQERMLNESGWAWRQVQPLLDLYNTDVSPFFVVASY